MNSSVISFIHLITGITVGCHCFPVRCGQRLVVEEDPRFLHPRTRYTLCGIKYLWNALLNVEYRIARVGTMLRKKWERVAKTLNANRISLSTD
ncbi:MAG: hypothetical protein ACFFEA_13240 [Candidatus Thorarchaeota archaeon]